MWYWKCPLRQIASTPHTRYLWNQEENQMIGLWQGGLAAEDTRPLNRLWQVRLCQLQSSTCVFCLRCLLDRKCHIFKMEGLPMKGALFCFLVGRSVACNKAGVPMPPAVAGIGTEGALFLLITNGSFLVRKLSLTWNGFCCPCACCWSAVSSAFNLYYCKYKTSSAACPIFYHQLKPGRGFRCLSRQVPTRHFT